MPPFPEQPSLAFADAVARIAPLRTFTAQAEAEIERLTSEVVTSRYSLPAGTSDYRKEDEYRSNGQMIGYLRPDPFSISSHYQTSGMLLNEKLLTDIAQDLRLPHTAIALMALNPDRPDTPTARLSLLPVAPSHTIHDYFGPSLTAAGLHYGPSVREAAFLQEQPQFIPAWAALAVFDLWTGNYDRHAGNLATEKQPHPGTQHCFYGFDMNKVSFHTEAMGQIYTVLEQSTCLHLLPPEPMIPAVNATLSAIENYPTARLNQLAQRLQPLNPRWNGTDAALRLDTRKHLLRSAMKTYFPHEVTQRLNCV